MSNKTWIQAHFPQLVLGLVAGGFALTLVELLWMHHTEDTQLVAVGATLAGALLSLVAVWARGGFKLLLAGSLGLVAVTGLVGTVMHFEEAMEHASGPGRAVAWVQSQTFAWADEDEQEGEAKGEEEEGLPPLAPLSVTGLAMLGALAAVVRPEA